MTSPQPLRLRVFFSSPGDVKYEREEAHKVLWRLQQERRYRGRVNFEAVAWDGPGVEIPMLATETPQFSVNQGLGKPSECDIVVVILWARMGTPLPDEFRKSNGDRYLSGTEWEFENAWQASDRPEILVYRRTEPPILEVTDPDAARNQIEQIERVKRFFDETFTGDSGSITGGVNEYAKSTDFREKLEAHLRELVERQLEALPESAQQGGDADRAVSPEWEGSPYPGLFAFSLQQAQIFCGRDRQAEELVEQLKTAGQRFIAVVGASGSGKSSVVAAGVRPRLQDWIWVEFTPGNRRKDPFLVLPDKLAELLGRQRFPADDIDEKLRSGADLSELVQHALGGRDDIKLVFFIDQFEELFTVCEAQHREPFINMLYQAASTPGLRIIVTLRSDFTAHCIEDDKLAGLLKAGFYPLPPPGIAELHEMTTRPAALAGLTFEPADLPSTILNDTGTTPGALALMAFALSELYEDETRTQKQVDPLTLAVYKRLGGVTGVLGKRAQDTYDSMIKFFVLDVSLVGGVAVSSGPALDSAFAPSFLGRPLGQLP